MTYKRPQETIWSKDDRTISRLISIINAFARPKKSDIDEEEEDDDEDLDASDDDIAIEEDEETELPVTTTEAPEKNELEATLAQRKADTEKGNLTEDLEDKRNLTALSYAQKRSVEIAAVICPLYVILFS